MGACGSTMGELFPFHGSDKRLTREQIQAVDKYLPDFRIYEVSTEAHRQIAANHWNAVFKQTPSSRSTCSNQSSAASTGRQASTAPKNGCESRITVLYDAFYQYLDQHSPELKPVFRSSMHVRSKVLVHISAGMRSILANQHVMETTLALTKTHLRFGVKLDYFNALGNALLYAMRAASDDEWTLEIEDAWRQLFTHCSAILLVHHIKELAHSELPKQLDTNEKVNGPEQDDIY